MILENESDIDLEEAVGSYLNCLSTSCAAGSKLYTSVGKIIDEKFHEIFPDKELNNQLVKTCFQSLQVQNAFEGYQKALLECKEKLLEILIDNHTKKHHSLKDSKSKKDATPEEKYAAVAFIVAKELYCYHQTVAEVLKPLLFSDFQEDFENATLTCIDGKDDIVTAWCTISEANKVLRHGYGLTNAEIGQILSWQHGADLSESCRKRLNLKINQLIQQYVDNFYISAACEELSIPLAFSRYHEDIQKLLQNCCSPSEALAAAAQGIPVVKEEIEVMLHRELPRVTICLNGRYYDKASPGKAFENTTLKMRAIREIISNLVEVKKIEATKEQIDMFCLRVLATSSITISYASSRTAVILAFGKRNLVKVKPPLMNDDEEKVVYFNIQKDVIEIDIQSKWCITEDSTLFASLCRDNTLRPIAVVDVSYHALINIEEYLVKRIEPTPVAHITQCVLRQSPTVQQKKEPGRERSKSIKIKLTKATTKLFHRKSVTKTDSESAIIANEYIADNETTRNVERNDIVENTFCNSENEVQPIPPPRLKRKAKKSRKAKCESQLKEEKERKEKEEKKEDLEWYSSSPKFGIPPVPTISGSKDFSPSVASFEELQGVIDFLSGSSSSSLAVNEKGEKIRTPFKTHKRNNSTTSIQSESKLSKVTPEGKLKLCHKKSASFSGETTELKVKDDKEDIIESLQPVVNEIEKISTENIVITPVSIETQLNNSVVSSDDCLNEDSESTQPIVIPVERTPGDGMDKVDGKAAFNSTVNIISKVDAEKSDKVEIDLSKPDITAPCSTSGSNEDGINVINSITASLEEVDLCKTANTSTKSEVPEKNVTNNEPTFNNSNKYVNKDELDQLSQNIFIPPKMSLIGISKGGTSQPLPKQVNSEPNNLNQICNENGVSNENVNIEIEPDVGSSVPNKMFAESEQHLPSRFLPDDERILINRFSKIPVELERSSKNKIPYDMERNPQNRFLSESGRNIEAGRSTPNRSLTDSEKSLSKVPSPISELDISLEERNQQILYEPFNSKWSVALGNKPASWSDATFDSECTIPKNDRLPNKAIDSEFTLDKQLDFNKLLEGSKFFAGEASMNENWKDRSYLPSGQNSFDGHDPFAIPPPHQPQMVNNDPWPLQMNAHSRNFSHFPSMSNHQVMKRNIESLQLPPNPVGPYMRQNREQLLAKQQILEQYARHQKQMQLQQQQQQQLNQGPVHPKQMPNPSMTPPPTSNLSSSNNFRMPNTHGHSAIDRSMSLPPGFSTNDRLNNMPSPRYDQMGDRASYRPLSAQRSGPGGHYMYGNQYSGMQSRSVNDMRMENAGMMNDKPAFSQMSEQNIFLEQYNQMQDAFTSRY